jgi:hypothetical protein
MKGKKEIKRVHPAPRLLQKGMWDKEKVGFFRKRREFYGTIFLYSTF